MPLRFEGKGALQGADAGSVIPQGGAGEAETDQGVDVPPPLARERLEAAAGLRVIPGVAARGSAPGPGTGGTPVMEIRRSNVASLQIG